MVVGELNLLKYKKVVLQFFIDPHKFMKVIHQLCFESLLRRADKMMQAKGWVMRQDSVTVYSQGIQSLQ